MLKLFSLLLLFTLLSQVWTNDSFNDFPLTIDKGNYLVHATLTDLNLNKKYFLKEYIHSSTYVRGKISISSESSDLADVHYGSSSKNQRLVVQNYDCDLFTYTTRWDKKINGLTKPLLNHVALVGPSLIYRLKHKSLVWKTGNDAVIRGATMHSAYTIISGPNELNITYYFKDTFDSGIDQPSRITIVGKDPSDYSSYVKESLVLDIYLQTQTDQEIDQIVIPKAGIGCPTYFISDLDFNTRYFNLVQDSVHYISTESVNGPVKSTTKNEVHADEVNQLLSLKTTSQGITTEAIYDYTLGLIYIPQSNGGCLVSPMGVNAPGVRVGYSYKPFRVDYLLDTSFNFRYLGESWFENRPGFKTNVWESISYGKSILSGQYDKVVTTIYTVDSGNGDTDSGMIPVGQTIHAYNKSSSGSYSLIETTVKVYYDFSQTIADESKFRIEDCYPQPSDRKTLKLQFNCKGSEKCDYGIEEYYYTFKAQVKSSIQNTHVISASRIGYIDLVLESNSIIAYVTFLNFPDISRGFKSSYMYLSSDVFKGALGSTADSSADCLKRNIGLDSSFEALAYCGKDKTCSRIDKVESLHEDQQSGTGCTVFYIPFKNLYRYSREIPLSGLQTELKGRELSFYAGYKWLSYSISRVDEVIEDDSKSRQLYSIENYSSKFVNDDSSTIFASSVTNLADCYRACANFDDDDCETFSYCQWSDKVECLLSTSVYANVTDKRVYDSGCQIYRKNHLKDYISIKNRAFINPTQIATDHWTDDCADLCSDSDECFSFQTCGGTCAFGGYYTDSSTKYSQDCDIYIPKVVNKYAPTGKEIVVEVYHTELNLNLDQCAALCYDLGTNQDACVSFNYCPKDKTTSTCQLSKYSVKNSLVESVAANECTNYELNLNGPNAVNKRKQNANTQKSSVKGTNGTAAFGIIMLFMAIGLLGGLLGFFVFEKSKNMINKQFSSKHDTFSWSRHLDEDEQIQSVI